MKSDEIFDICPNIALMSKLSDADLCRKIKFKLKNRLAITIYICYYT